VPIAAWSCNTFGVSAASVARKSRASCAGFCAARSSSAARAHLPNAFARRYTDDDLDALAEVEREYGRFFGPATVVVLRRMRQLYGDERFERLQPLSPSHLYNLAPLSGVPASSHGPHQDSQRSQGQHYRSATRTCPESRPGFIRIDSVHQGNYRGHRGGYHINAVDCVTQWEVVATVPILAREHMLPVLRAMLEQFPFLIIGFHSDGGSEYVNYDVSAMLEEERITFTRSRPRLQRQRAGRGEEWRGRAPAVRLRVRAGRPAKQFNEFCTELLNPFLNLHRHRGS
jgi:hypothetical protein